MGGLVSIITGDLAVIEPEGNVHTLDLFYGVLCQEGAGQERLSFVITFQFCDGICLLQLERDHIIRLQGSCELSRHH